MVVSDLMSSPVMTVRHDARLAEAAALLVKHRISGLAVVDAAGTLVGVISEADVLRSERGRPTEERTVGDAMSSPAWTIDPQASVAAAARRMVAEQVNRLPVVVDGRLLGIVTRADLVRAFVRPDAEICEEIRESAALRWHGIDPNGLTLQVEDGIVEVGPLSSPADAEVVERVLRSIPGVVSVECRFASAAVSSG